MQMSVFDYYLWQDPSLEDSLPYFCSWADMVEQFIYDPQQPFSSQYVPCAETAVTEYLLRKYLNHQQPVLLLSDRPGNGASTVMEVISKVRVFILYACVNCSGLCSSAEGHHFTNIVAIQYGNK